MNLEIKVHCKIDKYERTLSVRICFGAGENEHVKSFIREIVINASCVYEGSNPFDYKNE